MKNDFTKLLERVLNESSLSRVLQHINNPKTEFGVMSPFRKEKSDKENEERYKELAKSVRDSGYGYIPLRGGYTEEEGFVNERSLFIPKISRKEMIEYGKKYDQWSIIHKDLKDFAEIGTKQEAGIGKILSQFKIESDGRSIDLGAYELFKEFFSRLEKGSHRHKKFIFKMQEKVETSMYDMIKRRKAGRGSLWKNIFK